MDYIQTLVVNNLNDPTSLLRLKIKKLRDLKNSRLEMMAVMIWVLMPLLCGPLSWVVFYLLFKSSTVGKCLVTMYLLWIYMDRDSCERGGRRFNWFRRQKWWLHYRNYFPVKLVKTVDLPPDENYIFAVFPHGILSSGAFAAFSTDALNFNGLFTGLTSYLCTLGANFNMPVFRDFALAAGLISASKKSINWVLSSPGKGRVAVLVVGGAAEAMYSHPGNHKLILKNRKGFCRLALANGSPLVPVFSFGEIDIFKSIVPKENSWFRTFQNWVKKVTGFAPVLFYGTGIFNSYYGLLPRRVPITVVVGKPIQVKRVPHPTEEQVDELHKRFIKGIAELFNKEKHKYLEDPSAELVIV